MTIDPVTQAEAALDAARQQLDRSRANLDASHAKHTAAQQKRELLAGATLTAGDDDTFTRLAQATDDAETARRTADTAALIVKAAEKAIVDAEKALDLAQRRQVAARVSDKADELEALCAEIETLSQQLGAKMGKAISLEPTIADMAKHGLKIENHGYNRSLRDRFVEQLRNSITLLNRYEAPHFFHSLTEAAAKVRSRIENSPLHPRLEA